MSAEFHMGRAQEDAVLVAAYAGLFARVFCTDAKSCLFNLTATDLVERNAWICALLLQETRTARALSGLHCVIDGLGEAYIGGAVTDPTEWGRGWMDKLLDSALDALRTKLGIAVAKLTVRIDCNGQINARAFAVFSKHGFRCEHDQRIRISGLPFDAHLSDTAEHGGTFRARTMRANLRTRREAA